MGNLANNLNELSYPKTGVQRQVANPFYQEFVPEDNRAEIQNLQGMAAAIGQNQGNGPIARANMQGTQGNAANQINQSFGNLYNKNVEGARTVGAANTQEASKKQDLQSMYNKDYLPDVNNAQKDRWAKNADYNKNLVNLSNADQTRRRNFAWMNMTNPYYQLDSAGMPMNQTPAQRKALERVINGDGQSSAGDNGKIASIEKALTDGNIDRATAMRLYEDEIKYRLHPDRVRETWKNGIPNFSESGNAENINNPYMPHGKYGGKTLKAAKKKTIKMKVIGVPQ
jgi:hypothetical protein